MRIDGYEVNNGHVIAVFVTDKKRNMKQHKYEPARPHGEWKGFTDGMGRRLHRCSECERVSFEKSFFCSNCGAEFEGADFNDQIGG